MKRTLLSIIACLALVSGTAFAKSLVLTLNDGTLVYYLLGGETNPMMRFANGTITVDTDEYTISGIKNFYISEEDDPNAIEDVQSNGEKANYKNNILFIKGSTPVKVFSINGSEVEAEVDRIGDAISVGLNKLPKGTYIIHSGKTSFKVLKK